MKEFDRRKLLRRVLGGLLLAALFSIAPPADAERIKDIAMVEGVRANQLVGYGLVVGLDGTGDQTSQTPFTVQSIRNMLQQFGVTVPPNVNPQLRNVAAVTISAELHPFARPGQSIDITVSSIGNAKSLRGGTLLMAPLRGADGNVYAIAQGSLIVSGFGVEGADGSRISVNTTATGRIPNGATVERAVPSAFTLDEYIRLNLHAPDFTTAQRVAQAINAMFGDVAAAQDAAQIAVRAPIDASQRVAFVSMLENIEVAPASAPARVVVNSRTGTVVIGADVRVMPAAVAHGSLTVTIKERIGVSQPNPFGQGNTAIVPDSSLGIEQQQARMFMFEQGTKLEDIVRAINDIGAAPGDLVAILEALRQAGSLRAELIVI